MGDDVREGLTSTPKKLLPKYFYDALGSDLFEQITEVPEYYPMRAESALLEAIAPKLMATLQPDEIVELGSGSSTKTRILLDAQSAEHKVKSYVAFDVSESIIQLAADDLQQRYPGLEIKGVVGDFERHLDKIPTTGGSRLILFLGSTIGNLEPAPRVELLKMIAGQLGRNDHLLLGTDLVKDIDVIEAAYNDAQGVTAAFNKNILRSINNGLEGDFDPEAFEHLAYFNHDLSRIEMHLRPRSPQTAHLKGIGLTVMVSPEETIHTECSHKFTLESVTEMLRAAGLKLEEWYTGDEPRFGLSLSACMG
jgi:L-histidine N-alpha-methyltransferase